MKSLYGGDVVGNKIDWNMIIPNSIRDRSEWHKNHEIMAKRVFDSLPVNNHRSTLQDVVHYWMRRMIPIFLQLFVLNVGMSHIFLHVLFIKSIIILKSDYIVCKYKSINSYQNIDAS